MLTFIWVTNGFFWASKIHELEYIFHFYWLKGIAICGLASKMPKGPQIETDPAATTFGWNVHSLLNVEGLQNAGSLQLEREFRGYKLDFPSLSKVGWQDSEYSFPSFVLCFYTLERLVVVDGDLVSNLGPFCCTCMTSRDLTTLVPGPVFVHN